MSHKSHSRVDGTSRITTAAGSVPVSRRTTLKGLATAGLVSLVGLPSVVGATTHSPVSLVHSGTHSTVTGHGYAPGGTTTKDQHFTALRDESLFTAVDAPAVVNEWWETLDPWSLKSSVSPEAKFIWHDPDGYIGPGEDDQGSLEMIRVEETVELSAAQVGGGLSFTFGVDNYGLVMINGTEVGNTYAQNPVTDLGQYLVEGTNHLELRAINEGPYASPAMLVYDVVGQPQVTTIDLDVDVKPGNGDETDPINPTGKGTIPVAIASTAEFDATSLDVSTLRFGSVGVVEAGGGASPAHGGHDEDVDGDGLDDLVVHFPTADAGFVAGDALAKLVGQTGDGTTAVGTDVIRTVGGKGRGNGRGRGR